MSYDAGYGDMIDKLYADHKPIPPKKIKVETEVDYQYFNLIPHIAYNHHFYEIELRWLFFEIRFQNERRFLKNRMRKKGW